LHKYTILALIYLVRIVALAKNKRNQWRVITAVALTLWEAADAYGQSTALDAAVRQHERAVQDATRREAREVDSLSPDTDSGKTTSSAKPQAGACRVIQTIRLEGHPDAMGAQPQDVLSAYLGQCLITEEINALLGDLNRWYQRKGWTTTRVYAAEQDINGGELVLRVVAGRIEGYRYIDKAGDDRLTYAFPQEQEGYLNLRDLEQGLENLNRVPSQEAKFQLYPGNEPGTSVVVVEMTEKPRTRWTEMVDNSGTASMGHWRSNTEFAIGSPDPRVKAGAAAVGVVSTAVDFASKVVEQVARPNTGQGFVEVGATVLGDIANKVAPIAAPISNEIVEKMKNSDEVQTIQEKIGK